MIQSYKKNLFIEFSGWFIKLADFADKAEDVYSLPKLELLLHTGNVIRGCIIGYDRTRQEKLLMVIGIPDTNPKSEITLVPGSQVAAITFMDADTTVRVLESNSVVSTLELKRTAKKAEEDLEKSTTEKINLVLDTDNYPENNRKIVLETIKLLPTIFESLIEDELGKKAVIENIKNIKISIAEGDSIVLENKELHIKISSGYKFTHKEKERIKKQIENAL
ncbi:hypothetical protein [Flavobacterium chungangense]|uniref:Uncharacterized protein n=1 Tax=Flavobacterium chungangense TaxID=554283 RepID=A0A6V6ZBN5_9FLAO|nr:hypothetical protein [Flavobacterium chungangense]CAD0009045.1 hypothetical protein FLACHUCJ7_04064 [Flavobacterium chungangense]